MHVRAYAIHISVRRDIITPPHYRLDIIESNENIHRGSDRRRRARAPHHPARHRAVRRGKAHPRPPLVFTPALPRSGVKTKGRAQAQSEAARSASLPKTERACAGARAAWEYQGRRPPVVAVHARPAYPQQGDMRRALCLLRRLRLFRPQRNQATIARESALRVRPPRVFVTERGRTLGRTGSRTLGRTRGRTGSARSDGTVRPPCR
jgi:hypothetical protein